jgi:hypothetical protein
MSSPADMPPGGTYTSTINIVHFYERMIMFLPVDKFGDKRLLRRVLPGQIVACGGFSLVW